MKIRKLFCMLIICFFIAGFAAVKFPVNTARENNCFVYKNSIVEQSALLNDEIEINGIVLLVSVKTKTNFFIELSGADEKLKQNVITLAIPENRKYQTLKIMFDKFRYSGVLKIKAYADSDFYIWYSDNKELNSHFIVDSEKIFGMPYLELIKPLDLRNKFSEFITKFSINKSFMFFYFILLFFLLILLVFNKKIYNMIK